MSISNNLRYGRAYIHVTGLGHLASMPGATLELGGVDRTPFMQHGQLVGFSEQDVPAKVSCDISVGVGDNLSALRQTDNATITFECDTGVTWMVSRAFLAKAPVLKQADGGSSGNVALEFIGNPAQELAAPDNNPNAQ